MATPTVVGMGAIGARLSERLAIVKRTAEEYSALVDNLDSTETQLHEFIKAHPWLVGLDYTRVRSKQAVIRGAVDFLLERYDGFHDFLELKGPAEPIILVTTHADPAIPSSPHSYSLSPALAQALAQAHAYREQLTDGEAEITRWYGIDRTRNPRILIVIGREKGMPDHAARVLQQLNLSLHRVEIVPFDQLGKRALCIINNVIKSLVEESPESETSAGADC